MLPSLLAIIMPHDTCLLFYDILSKKSIVIITRTKHYSKHNKYYTIII